MNWIAGQLNKQGTPGPRGGKWYRATVKEMLTRRAYRGDFSFNEQRSGQFYQIDDNREVVESNGTTQRKAKDKGVIVTEGRYKPLIDPATFGKAQKWLEVVGKDRRRRKRQGYPLTGILFCDHCGKPLYGCKPNSLTVYRCSANGNQGAGACKYYQVREADILPFVLRLLGEEIDDLKAMLTAPPDGLCKPHKERTEQRELLEQDRAKLAARIAKAEENLLFVEDARTRKSLDERVSAMRDELGSLEAELAVELPDTDGYTRDDLAALTAWWEEFDRNAVSVPVSADANLALAGGLMQDPFAEESAVLLDPCVVNEALHTVGAEVRLRWRTEPYKTSGGKARKRHTLARGRFRLGQQNGKVPQHVLYGAAQRACAVGRPFTSESSFADS